MQKLGMKPVPGITRVTIKKSKNVGPFFDNCHKSQVADVAWPTVLGSTHGQISS